MADTRQARNRYYSGPVYSEGSAVRREAYEAYPDYTYPSRDREQIRKENRHREAEIQIQKNRARAMNTNKGFIIFLTGIIIAMMFVCISFIRLKSNYTYWIDKVAEINTQWAELKEENDANYGKINADFDLENIRKIAITRLGMRYPSEDQKETYTMTESVGYIRQYAIVP